MIKSNATKNIIVIDDDIVVLNSLKFILRNTKHNISYFSNSKEALEELLNNYYDIVITDIEMPNLSGIDVVINVKKNTKLGKVIFISSNIDGYKKIILKNSFLYIEKPISKDILINLIEA